MKNVLLWALIATNAVLCGSFLGLRWHENAAKAQMPAGGARRAGDYLMIDGQISGGNVGLVYVVDTVNGQLTALTYQGQAGNASQIESMPPIDLGAIFAPEQQAPAKRKY